MPITEKMIIFLFVYYFYGTIELVYESSGTDCYFMVQAMAVHTVLYHFFSFTEKLVIYLFYWISRLLERCVIMYHLPIRDIGLNS